MGTRVNYLFDGVDGATATTASTGAADVQVTNAGGSITHESDVGLHGTTGLRVHYGTGTGNPVMGRFGLASANNQVSLSVNLALPTTNPTVEHRILTVRSSSGNVGYIYRGASGNFAFQPASGVPTPLLTAATLSTERNVRVTLTLTGGSTTSGSFAIKFYNSSGAQIGTTYTGSSQNLSANAISTIQLGTAASEGNSIVYGFEDLQIEEGVLTEIGPYVPSIPLGTPVVTIVDVTPASTIGGSDGEVDISFPAVVDADHYEVAVANAHGATSGFTNVTTSLTGTGTVTYTITGRAAGPGRVRVIAVPA